MAFALYDEYGDAGFATFDAWSSQDAERYKAVDAKSTWRSVARQSSRGASRPVTIGTLIYLATQAGWKGGNGHRVRLSDDEAKRIAAEREARRAAQAQAEADDQAAAAAKAQELWNSATPAPHDHAYLKRKRIDAGNLRHLAEWVIESINDETGEVRKLRIPDVLLVPIWSSPGRLSSLQAIFANSKNPLKRDKDFLKNGRTRGCYTVIGNIGPDTVHVIVCEGYATGDSLNQATGWPVMVTFTAGNLAAVTRMVRERLPKAIIVIAADNDQFTKRADGTAYNPGVEAATRAADEFKAVLAVPQFVDTSSKPTDFNDLAAMAGLDIVRAQIEVAINPPAPPAVEPGPGEVEAGGAAEPPKLSDAPLDTLGHDCRDHFRILGYDHETYYFMSTESRQVVTCTKRDFTDVGLLELAPLDWWEVEFPGEKGPNKKMAADWLIRACRAAGIYDNSRVRGRGAWIDSNRIIYHHGEKLSVDGIYTAFDSFTSRYVYELDRALPEPHEEMLSGDMGEWLLDLAEMFRWTMPASAALLAGWCALAPVCGALRWRPHLWITGGAGCGKSTVLNDFVHLLMGGVDIYAQGASSEAGIRQTLRADALPVLFDESESKEEADARRIQNVLNLIRQASTESQARTLKGTAFGDPMAFHIRSMFCLASIQVAINNQADIERLAVLRLRPKRDDEDAAGTWRKMQDRLAKLRRDADLPAKLQRRSLNLLPITLQSIGIFSNAFAEQFGSVRDGDQYGTLLAGAWSMISDRLPTHDEALELINRYDWSEHREDHDTDDSERALAYLLESRVRINGALEVTVNELVRAAAGRHVDANIGGRVAADTLLQRWGMRITDDDSELLLSNNSRSLRQLLADTPFAADIRGQMLRVPGAHKNNNVPARFNGSVSKCVAIPLGPILVDDDVKKAP